MASPVSKLSAKTLGDLIRTSLHLTPTYIYSNTNKWTFSKRKSTSKLRNAGPGDTAKVKFTEAVVFFTWNLHSPFEVSDMTNLEERKVNRKTVRKMLYWAHYRFLQRLIAKAEELVCVVIQMRLIHLRLMKMVLGDPSLGIGVLLIRSKRQALYEKFYLSFFSTTISVHLIVPSSLWRHGFNYQVTIWPTLPNLKADTFFYYQALMGSEALGGVSDNIKFWETEKMDLGSCPKVHSERLKMEYEEARQKNEYNFETEFERNLAIFVQDCDRKISSAQRRLDKTPEDSAKTTRLIQEIAELENDISELTKEVEVLGEEGKVTESMKILQDVEAKKAIKTEKEKDLKNSAEGGGPSQQQKLRVCEICSAYLSIFDSDRRDLLKELREKSNKSRSESREEPRPPYNDRDRDRGYERDRRDRGRHDYDRRPSYERRSRSRSLERRSGGYGGVSGGGGRRRLSAKKPERAIAIKPIASCPFMIDQPYISFFC
ncbi:hypothetical protein G9A89_008055 [Geosiphon pyriformis]|nr:hypothetical protein G9A89_008055 [Geosiphon pyriformis]